MQADVPAALELRPWTFNEAAALIGKNLEYSLANHAHALYQILGVYQAQNGAVMVMVAGDAISTDKLLKSKHYSFEGQRCGCVAPRIMGVAV